MEVESELAKVKIAVPLSDLIKIPSQCKKVKRFLGFEEAKEVNEDWPVVLKAINHGRKNDNHSPLFITLMINDLLLHN